MSTTRHVETLKAYMQSLSDQEKDDFSERCGTTYGYLKLVMYGVRKCNPDLAINIDRESKGAVRCDDLCPQTDFDYLRSQPVTCVQEV